MSARLYSLLFLAVTTFGAVSSGRAQVVSPGKLSNAHADLEGLRSCTRCHELRKKGIAPERCLECHTLLRTRIARGEGYHATVRRRGCAECHKEHSGREFEIVRLDTASFRHADTGYELRGAHTRVGCRACHKAEHVRAADVRAYHGGAIVWTTMLGLPTGCAGCHSEDDPHATQFAGRACDACHDETTWNAVPRFDHGNAGYRLTGRHREVECAGCHRRASAAVRWVGVEHRSCESCHKDPHAGTMGLSCSTCHSTAGWDRVQREMVEGKLDHARTGFMLLGRHAVLECAACHGKPPRTSSTVRIRFVASSERASYPRPSGTDCIACHVDYHNGAFRGTRSGVACNACHSERGWLPTSFDLERHDRTAFALTGAHRVVPCAGCHGAAAGKQSAPWYRLRDRECRVCHAKDDPHQGMFAEQSCVQCHTTERFSGAAFDHKALSTGDCRSCHTAEDPHQGQFGSRNCVDCHAIDSFRIARFDHTRTRFPLGGAHSEAACASCHPTEQGPAGAFVRYSPLGTACRDCHGVLR